MYGLDWFYSHFASDYPDWASEHINVLELLTVLQAVKRWGYLWQGMHIRVRSDSSATVAAINKGSSKSPVFMRILREVFWYSVFHDFRLTSLHIKGEHNVLADTISRLHLPGFQNRFIFWFNPLSGAINCQNNMSCKSFMFLQDFSPR